MLFRKSKGHTSWLLFPTSSSPPTGPTPSAPPDPAPRGQGPVVPKRPPARLHRLHFGAFSFEDLEEIARLKDDLVAAYRPANSQQLFALERVAVAQQSVLRAARLESGMFLASMQRGQKYVDSPHRVKASAAGAPEIADQQNRNLALAEGLDSMCMNSNVWSLFLRYRAHATRDYKSAVDEFNRVRVGSAANTNRKTLDEPIFSLQSEQTEADPSGFETNPFDQYNRQPLAPTPLQNRIESLHGEQE